MLFLTHSHRSNLDLLCMHVCIYVSIDICVHSFIHTYTHTQRSLTCCCWPTQAPFKPSAKHAQRVFPVALPHEQRADTFDSGRRGLLCGIGVPLSRRLPHLVSSICVCFSHGVCVSVHKISGAAQQTNPSLHFVRSFRACFCMRMLVDHKDVVQLGE